MFASPIEVSQHVAAGKLKYRREHGEDARRRRCRTCRRSADLGHHRTSTSSRGSASWRRPARPRTIVGSLSQEIGQHPRRAGRQGEVRRARARRSQFLPADEFDRFLAREREQWATGGQGVRRQDRLSDGARRHADGARPARAPTSSGTAPTSSATTRSARSAQPHDRDAAARRAVRRAASRSGAPTRRVRSARPRARRSSPGAIRRRIRCTATATRTSRRARSW